MFMALSASAWTLSELDRLPDDDNKYELIDGELFVTPLPTTAHEQLAAVLLSILVPYVRAERLGNVYTPRAAATTNRSAVSTRASASRSIG